MKAGQEDIPRERSVSIPLTATYQNLVLKIVEFGEFLRVTFLCM